MMKFLNFKWMHIVFKWIVSSQVAIIEEETKKELKEAISLFPFVILFIQINTCVRVRI